MMYSCVIKCCILCVRAALIGMKIMKIVYMLLHMENSTGPELAMAQTKLDWSYLFNGKNTLEKGENNKKLNIKRP